MSQYAPLILRIGLGIVMLWFGYQQLAQPDNWIGWVPEWISAFGLSAPNVVFLNGIFEVAAGALLILGVFTRIVSMLLFLHLILIILEIGFTAIGMRDVAIAVAFAALSMLGGGPYALLEWPRRKSENGTIMIA